MSGSVPPSLRAALEAYRARLQARFGARLHEVRLFGSWARGEAREDSDVDVLVLIDHMGDLEIFDVVSEATPILLSTGLPIAPLPMATEKLEQLRRSERALARALDTEGIPV